MKGSEKTSWDGLANKNSPIEQPDAEMFPEKPNICTHMSNIILRLVKI